MIDFNNASFMKLRPVDNSTYWNDLAPMMVQGEQPIATFRGMRDGVVFTTKRVIAVNMQGITGKKVDYTSLPYSKVQSFSVETAGVIDLDSELEMWFSGLGKVKFEFLSGCDVKKLASIIGNYLL